MQRPKGGGDGRQPEHYSRPFHPVADKLRGTYTDNYRHLVARATFMHSLCSHPRVIETFNSWGRESGIYAAGKRAIVAYDEVAKALGVRNRDFLFDDNALEAARTAFAKIPEGDRRTRRHLQRSLESAEKAADELGRTIEKGARRFAPTPRALAKELVKPSWPWIAVELLDEFFRDLNSSVLSAEIMREWSVEQRDDAPVVQIPAFETVKGESRKDAWARMLQWHRSYVAAAAASLEGKGRKKNEGRLPRVAGEAVLKRNVRWFYSHRVEGVSKDQLARDYCYREHARYDSQHNWRSDRKTIRDGVAEAERVLALSQYRWK